MGLTITHQVYSVGILTVKVDVGRSLSKATANDFEITITSGNPKPPKPATFMGSSTGTDVVLGPGDFTVSVEPLFTENPNDHFGREFSRDCFSDSPIGGGIIHDNEHLICTISVIPVGPPEF
jgi:hypothetical protein